MSLLHPPYMPERFVAAAVLVFASLIFAFTDVSALFGEFLKDSSLPLEVCPTQKMLPSEVACSRVLI